MYVSYPEQLTIFITSYKIKLLRNKHVLLYEYISIFFCHLYVSIIINIFTYVLFI